VSPEAQAAANRAVAERYAKAWLAGDLTALRACYHPDFTLHYFGDHPLSGDHVGLAAALATLAEVSRRTRRKLVRIVDVTAGSMTATRPWWTSSCAARCAPERLRLLTRFGVR
jgi:ketosteroid isomerase-like protein